MPSTKGSAKRIANAPAANEAGIRVTLPNPPVAGVSVVYSSTAGQYVIRCSTKKALSAVVTAAWGKAGR